jgi:hypothetical protein
MRGSFWVNTKLRVVIKLLRFCEIVSLPHTKFQISQYYQMAALSIVTSLAIRS